MRGSVLSAAGDVAPRKLGSQQREEFQFGLSSRLEVTRGHLNAEPYPLPGLSNTPTCPRDGSAWATLAHRQHHFLVANFAFALRYTKLRKTNGCADFGQGCSENRGCS